MEQLADLACGVLRKKIPQLRLALEGHCTEHHRFMLGRLLSHLNYLESQIERFQPADRAGLDELLPAEDGSVWMRIPGVNRHDDRERDRGDRRGHGRVPRRAPSGVVDAASVPGTRSRPAVGCGAARARGTAGCVGRWRKRPGRPATPRTATWRRSTAGWPRGAGRSAPCWRWGTLLVIIYHVLKNQQEYNDLGADYFDRLEPERLRRYLVKRLQRLGYEVDSKPKEVDDQPPAKPFHYPNFQKPGGRRREIPVPHSLAAPDFRSSAATCRRFLFRWRPALTPPASSPGMPERNPKR